MNNNVEASTSNKASLGGLEKYGMLLMGIFLVILSGGRFVTPSAAFLAPVFLLRFTRNTSTRLGIFVLFFLLFISLLVRLHDYVSVPRPQHLFLIAGLALLETLPFLLDRKLFKKLPKVITPFVLPCVFVVLGFAVSQLFPFGSMGEKAYSQVGNLELMQLLGVTGIHGITFVIFWFAAAMASLWDAGFTWRKVRSQVMPVAIVLMIIFVSGGFRTIFDDNESETVRVAGVVGDQQKLIKSLQDNGVDDGMKGLLLKGYSTEKVKSVLNSHLDDLFTRTIREANAGASIVSWAEADGVVFKKEESTLIQRAGQTAVDEKIYLIATLAVIDEPTDASASKGIENKLLVFNPQGETIGQYTKNKSLWNEPFATSENDMLVLDTEFGKLAFAIGFDLDFPAAIRKAGFADIIIAPSADWRTLSPHHSLMATFRGVENGTSVFRPTSNGLSIASDSLGRILAQTDHYRTTPHTLVADIPTRGVVTFYSGAGDWFAWLNIVLLALIIVAALFYSRRGKDSIAQQPIKNADQQESAEARNRSRITAIQWREAQRDNNLDKDN